MYLFSTFKFFKWRSLEERYPGLHTLFGNVKALLGRLQISDRKPSQQLLFRHIKKMDFTAGSKAFGPQPVIFTFFSCPKAEIEDDIHSQF